MGLLARNRSSATVRAQAAMKTTAALKPGSDTELNAQILEDIAGDAPNVTIAREAALQPVAEVMATCELQPSKAAAKRCAHGTLHECPRPSYYRPRLFRECEAWCGAELWAACWLTVRRPTE